MALCFRRLSAVLLCAGASLAIGQQAPIIQPGAPGASSRTLSASAVVPKPRAPLEADVSFMQGMIHHHQQAVEMVDLMRTRSRNKRLLSFGDRISISQTDEIQFMRQWLGDRGQKVPMNHSGMKGHDMPGMMDMSSMPLMPGMLSAEQMKALAAARGPAFDRLFLTGMIQHHTGALIMVDDLFGSASAGQDAVLYDFATDIDNTQRAEIEIMKGMLKEKK
jgi:uncharacterized protein (DUF305 family)